MGMVSPVEDWDTFFHMEDPHFIHGIVGEAAKPTNVYYDHTEEQRRRAGHSEKVLWPEFGMTDNTSSTNSSSAESSSSCAGHVDTEAGYRVQCACQLPDCLQCRMFCQNLCAKEDCSGWMGYTVAPITGGLTPLEQEYEMREETTYFRCYTHAERFVAMQASESELTSPAECFVKPDHTEESVAVEEQSGPADVRDVADI